MDPQAAINPIPIESVNKDTRNTIKNLAIKSNPKQQRYIIITKCLCDPCPIFYTDTISESIIIECSDARHQQKVERPPSQPPTIQPVLGTTQETTPPPTHATPK